MANILSDRHNKNDNYETPSNVFDPLNEAFRFTLDVCAQEHNHKVDSYFSTEQNGLLQPWGLNTCWCNPPYSNVRDWVEKAVLERQATTVCLLPGRPDTRAWQDCIFPFAAVVCFMRGRIKFVGQDYGAKFPSALAVFSMRPLNGVQLVALARFGSVSKMIMGQVIA